MLNLKNASWGSVEYVIVAILQLIAIPVIVKGIGVQMYGVWVISNTFLGLSGILSLGMGQTTLKYVSKYRALQNMDYVSRIICATLTVYLFISFISAVVLFFASRPLIQHVFTVTPENMQVAVDVLRITSLGLVFYFANMSFDAAIRGFERFDFAVSAKLFIMIGMQAGRIGLILAGFGIRSVIWFTVCMFICEAGLKIWILRRHFLPGFKPVPLLEMQIIREIFSFGLFTWFNTMILLLRTNLEPMILGALLGTEALTYYFIAKGLVDQVLNLIGKTFAFVFPATSKLFEMKDAREIIGREFNRFSFVALSIGVFIIAPMAYLSYPLLEIWIGKDIAVQTYTILKFMCIAYAFQPLGVINGNYLYALGEVKLMTMINALSTVVILSAMVWGASVWGMEGAVKALCLTIIFVFLNRLLVESKIFEHWQMSKLLRLMVATLLPVITAVYLPYKMLLGSNLISILLWGSVIGFCSVGALVIIVGEYRSTVYYLNRLIRCKWNEV